MIEIRDNKSRHILHKHAVVYEHLSDLYEKQWQTVYGKLTGTMRALIFQQIFVELIAMAQAHYLEDYYERIIKNAV